MKKFAMIHYFYNSLLARILRFCLFLVLFSFSALGLINKASPNFFLLGFSLFLFWEIFFEYKISRLMPKLLVSDNKNDPLDSFTIEALGIFEENSTAESIVKSLLSLPQVKFIIIKTDVTEKEVVISDLDKSKLANSAFVITSQLKGKYVTTMDLFCAYLLMTETSTKFLFSKKLKPEDLQSILLWARNTYQKEESSKKTDLSFAGEGIAESWVYGWTIETKKYLLDLTSEFVNKNTNSIGRSEEYKQLLEALGNNKSAILVGDPGSGKSAVVENLAVESYMGKLSGNLFHQRVMQLMVDAFMAGAKTQGELEERLDAIIAEVSHSGDIIVYIPNLENILGNSSFNLNISGALIPYIQKGKIRVIATSTEGAYKKFIEPLSTFLENFYTIKFDQLDKQTTLEILFRKAESIEDKSKTSLTYKAILEAYSFAGDYAREKVLPGSAVILLEDTASAVGLSGKKIVEEKDIEEQIKKKIHINVSEPKAEEKKLLLNLETEIHKRIIDQNEAVSTISEAMRRIRTGLNRAQKPISFLFLGPTGVGKTETAKALSAVYFGSEDKMIRFDMSEFTGEDGEKRLLGAPPGQGDEKGQLTEKVYDNPYSLILLDEFEKADRKILDLFLQVFDDGRLTDNKGKTVSFINSIIIATSNAASEYIREQVEKGVLVDANFHSQLLEYLQINGIFQPELLNRFDAIIIFKPLSEAEVAQIVKIILTEFSKTLVEKDIYATFDDKVIAKIAKQGFDKEFGARPLRRFVQDNIEDLVAKKMLSEEIKRGDKITISVDQQNNILINRIN